MKKAIGMFAALAVALAMTGIAYAHWSQTIYIDGSVSTGSVCVGWENVYCNDYGIDPGYDKDVASCDAYLWGWKGMHGDNDIYENLTINISNVYPCYSVTVTAVVANCGTIPLHIYDAGFTILSDPKGLEPFLEVTCDCFPENLQLHPCESVEIECTLHVLQEVGENTCPENATLTFAGYVTFGQWNLAPY